MSYPKQVLDIKPTLGFVWDTPPPMIRADVLTTAVNVLCRNGQALRVPGYRDTYAAALATAAPSAVVHALNCNNAGTNYWLVFADDGEAFALEGSNATQIDNSLLSAVSDPWRFSSALLNGVAVVSNGIDDPVYWAGGVCANLSGWTATESCEFIAAFKYHLFALDISGPGGNFPNLLRWSHAAEPGTLPTSWTPAADNEAGDVELSDTPGPLLCAYPLRDQLIIYKPSSMYAASYVGGNQKYAFRRLQSRIGSLTRRSVADLGGQHLVITGGDIILTNGASQRSIGESRITDYFFNQLDSDTYFNVFCRYAPKTNEVLIGFPRQGSALCNAALVYDVAADSFGVRELDQAAGAAVGQVTDTEPSNTWAAASGTWEEQTAKWGKPSQRTATDSLVILEADSLRQQEQDEAVTLQAIAGRDDIDFGDPERVKFVRRVHVDARPGYGTLLVRLGGRMKPSDSVAWSTEVAVTEPDSIVNTFAVGRYISVQVRSIGADAWTLSRIGLEAEMRGYY